MTIADPRLIELGRTVAEGLRLVGPATIQCFDEPEGLPSPTSTAGSAARSAAARGGVAVSRAGAADRLGEAHRAARRHVHGRGDDDAYYDTVILPEGDRSARPRRSAGRPRRPTSVV